MYSLASLVRCKTLYHCQYPSPASLLCSEERMAPSVSAVSERRCVHDGGLFLYHMLEISTRSTASKKVIRMACAIHKVERATVIVETITVESMSPTPDQGESITSGT